MVTARSKILGQLGPFILGVLTQEGIGTPTRGVVTFRGRRCPLGLGRAHHPMGTASLIAQSVKNLPAMQERWVRFLGREDPLE